MRSGICEIVLVFMCMPMCDAMKLTFEPPNCAQEDVVFDVESAEARADFKRVLECCDACKCALYKNATNGHARDFVAAYRELLERRCRYGDYWSQDMTDFFYNESAEVRRQFEWFVQNFYDDATSPCSENWFLRIYGYFNLLLGQWSCGAIDDEVRLDGQPRIWWVWDWPNLSVHVRSPNASPARRSHIDLDIPGNMPAQSLYQTLSNVITTITPVEARAIAYELVEHQVFMGDQPLSALGQVFPNKIVEFY